MSEVASQTLHLVSKELGTTLDQTRRALEDYVERRHHVTSLQKCAEGLHVVQGVLRMVEIYGAALLAEEMEQVARYLLDSADEQVSQADGLEALTRAMVQLPAYLDRVQSGGRDVALVLLPLLNDLRAVRGNPLLSEGTLLLLNLSTDKKAKASKPPPTKPRSDVVEVARRLRPRFQTSLLHWIKGESAAKSLALLAEVSDALEKSATGSPVHQLWWVVGGVIEALREGGLETSVSIKRLLAQTDRQIKRLIDVGEAAFSKDPALELLNSLLYYVARATTNGERVSAIRASFSLGELLPADEQIESARESLSAPSVKLMKTVAAAIKEDLNKVKDVLDIYVRTGMADVRELEPQLGLLKKIGDTLGVLGLGTLRTEIQSEIDHLQAIVGEQAPADENSLVQMAATLLNVEDNLDDQLLQLIIPAEAGDEEAGAEDGEDEGSGDVEYRQVTEAVLRECIVNLARVKEAIASLVDNPEDAGVMDTVPQLLRGITAGLLMLNKSRAVALVERIATALGKNLKPGETHLSNAQIDRLADSIVSVEYYMETIQAGRGDPWYMLDNAEGCMEAVERLEPTPVVPEERTEIGPFEKTVQLDVPEGAPVAEPAAADAAPEVHRKGAEKSDPEFLELFIEEAKEEIGVIDKQFPLWAGDPTNEEPLTTFRRSFHTLKGSGRTVGADLIGEFAWAVENLLNRIISGTLDRTPAIVAYLKAAVAALPELIEQLEVGSEPTENVLKLIEHAKRFAEEDPAVTLEYASGVHEEDTEPGETVVPSQMDPVLQEIFTKETAGHLKVIREYLDTCDTLDPPYPVTEALHRSCHTLSGSANMAGAAQGVKIAEPLNRYIRHLYDSGQGLSEEGLEVCAEVVAAIENIVEHINENTGYFKGHGALITRLLQLEEELEQAEQEAAAAQPATEAQDDSHAETQVPVAETIELDISLEADETEPEPEVEPEPETAPGPAFDPDIAAIFSDEATELLEATDSAFAGWRGDSANSEHLAELRRHLHTLKGGARMAGIAAMGDLSHDLETLITNLSSGAAATDDSMFQLVQQSIDELHRMRDLVSSGQAPSAVADLRDRIHAAAAREVAVGETTPTVEPPIVEPPAVEVDLTEAPSKEPTTFEVDLTEAPPEEPVEAVETPVPALADGEEFVVDDFDLPEVQDEVPATVTPEVPEEIPEPEPPAVAEPPASAEPPRVEEQIVPVFDEAPVERQPAPTAEPGEQPATQKPPVERQDVARVDAQLLDEMLNNAGEISIFRSRLEQQVSSIEFNLDELSQTVDRLKEQLRKMEIETETQIINRHQEDVAGSKDFDPLELDRYSTIQQLSRALAESVSDVGSIRDLLKNLSRDAESLLVQQSRVTTALQDGLMRTRMVPFSRHLQRLQRVVRQAAADTGKKAELRVRGASGELDRQVLEKMLPPFGHMLRNAVVHGIEPSDLRRSLGKPETGRIGVDLHREGSEMIIDVFDDGAGLDFQAIRQKAELANLITPGETLSDDDIAQLVLEPGFSTAGTVTQAAGRGVGLDVVANEVKKLGGSLGINSVAGEGTRFRIRLPFTLAITQALIVRTGNEQYALPLPTVEGIARVPRSEVDSYINGNDPVFEYGGHRYRFQHLGLLIGGPPTALPDDDAAVSVILVRAGDHSTALLADEMRGSREIVVKSVGPQISGIRGISGATILGDGSIVLILDAGSLVRAEVRGRVTPDADADKADRRTFALVVDDSITVRRVTQRLLERNGMRVMTAKDGVDAVAILQDHVPDIILLDIEMPRMDGYEVATHVRNSPRLKDVPIVMITSRVGAKHRARAIEIGVNDYLGKPYQESQLLEAIEPLVRERAL